MASRESQGLQVALILFVMVTVVLAVTTYLYFSTAEKEKAKALAAEARAKQSDDAVNSLEFQNQILKHVLGYETKTKEQLETIVQSLKDDSRKEMDQVLANFEQDAKLYGAGLTGQAVNYRTLPSHLVAIVNDKNSKLADADKRQDQLVQERQQIQAAEQQRVAKAEAALAQAQADLAAERAKFNQDRQVITDARTQLANMIPEKDKQLNQVSSESSQKIESMQKLLTQQQLLIDSLREKLQEEKTPTFEVADGEVTNVNQGARIAWVNLGSADGIQRQMTFSVYDKNQTGVASAPVKGRIEITRVMEAHLSEARILDDDLSDPVMQGDQIYSPSFRKGQRTHFALAGFLDIDGDGRSDQEKVKSIITTNNGVIDVELQPDGTIAGKLTPNTRYLVKGAAPTDKSNERLTKGYSQMIDDATKQGVESIALDTLMERMGYVDDSRVVQMQRSGMLPQGDDPDATTFRKRTPAAASP